MLAPLIALVVTYAPVTPSVADNAVMAIDLPELVLVAPGAIQGGDTGGLN